MRNAMGNVMRTSMKGKTAIEIASEYTAIEIAAEMRKHWIWIQELCEALCIVADMKTEWEASNADTFEEVLNKAAEKLGVEIY